jgi:TRAP-type C4-dicarboxylate transport system permease small subunit
MNRLIIVTSWLFGVMLLALSLFVTIETISRKLWNYSFQGADELGGYVLAVGGALSFTIALWERGHVRIDLIHDRLPARMQALLNWLSILLLSGFGLFFAWYGFKVIQDTLAYKSAAATPWATPLIYPQSVWYAALALFALTSAVLLIRATLLLLKGRIADLNAGFHPRGAMEELAEEISDLERR